MSVTIKVENLSKAYQLGEIGTGTISHDIERWIARKRGKEDPFLKVGEINDRTTAGKSNIVWSLKDINFEIEQGHAVGIIGRNGAGKSTLLKLLSRVTGPTSGSIKVKGRIASLLEVGTGFHPELTGKENIYLNGAILGMRKKEIDRKLDQIIDFSGVERYIGTPVKRYSSGMYVRLAFAVAAHLESEILIVDEVLAVGDADFQKKCLGKMGDVSRNEGRTVLFVSHNIAAVKNLCRSCILIDKGQIIINGKTDTVISSYLESSFLANKVYYHKDGNFKIKINDISINDSKIAVVKIFDEIEFSIRYDVTEQPTEQIEFFLLISNSEGEYISGFFQEDNNLLTDRNELTGIKKLYMNCSFVPGRYYVSVGIINSKNEFIDWVDLCESFLVDDFYNDNRIFRPRLGYTVGNGVWKNDRE
jgi:lipopolysaccharide transport system ATP-binding protein